MVKLLKHYKKLFFYNFNRFKGYNYQAMREYLAQVLIDDIEEFLPLRNKKVLDVGGAMGEFCKVINEKRKCDAINLEPYPETGGGGKNPCYTVKGDYIWPNTIKGFADDIPFDDNSFDLVICRGVLEHIPREKQQKSLNEMYRVTRVNGFCYLQIPPWYSPHAGHELKPFHVLPFKMARFLRNFIFRSKIDRNSLEELNLYPITFGRTLKMIDNSGFKIISTRDTHLRIHFLTKIPLLREIAVTSAVFILKKTK